MSLLTLTDLTLRIGGRTLLDKASLAIDAGRRVGLVGRNGAGKSTLLRVIAGELAPDGGTVRRAARTRLAQVRQEAPAGPRSLLETVLDADHERAALIAELSTAPPERLADLHERLITIEADAAPARAATILGGLGFDEAAQARPCAAFSGGWRMRVALAAALFANPDLLLLDEPSNHLDLEATLWLQSWLARFSGAALIVSHDRELLDQAAEQIAHLDRGTLTLYHGNFQTFARVRAEQAMQQARAAERAAAERAHMQAFVDRFRAKASKARQAQSRLKALARLPSLTAVVEDAVTRFAFPEPQPLAPPFLTLDQVAVGYDGQPVLRNLSLSLDGEDRVALLGANGRGKSTFAKLIAGTLAPLAGTLYRTPRLRVGYFAQHQSEALVLTDTPLDHVQRALPRATLTSLRAQLARFGLDADRAGTAVGALSGGEKARLLLALATRDAPQLLILDEPTNHLDIDAREALIRALAAFAGAVLLISHDPHLVGLVADRLWLVGDGTVRPFDGDLDEYRAQLAEAGRAGGIALAEPLPAAGLTAAGKHAGLARRKDDRRGRAALRSATAPLRRQVAVAEARLGTLAAERAAIETRLADPRSYAAAAGAVEAALARSRLLALAREERTAEAEWLAASEALEQAAD